MNCRLSFILCLMCFCTNVCPQTQDYSNFRDQVLGNFHGFRKNVIDNYAHFLDTVWTQYDIFRGSHRNRIPKPVVAPVADSIPPYPAISPVISPNPEIKPLSPINPIDREPQTPVLPKIATTIEFEFYGHIFEAPCINYVKTKTRENKDIANAWREYQKCDMKDVVSTLKSLSANKGLNDWFTFQMIQRYVDAVVKEGNDVDRIILQHYLLTNMGYDVRLAKTERKMSLLVPFKQTVYEKKYIHINDEKYYVFSEDVEEENKSEHIYTYNIPDGSYSGEFLDLTYRCQNRIEEGDFKQRTLSDGILKITGCYNVTMMEMLRHYPQMDVPEYARSFIDTKLRADIVAQLRPQIQGLSQEDAANKLIHFVQYAFDYETDGEQHGYEKTYFLEENFYYPKNDCEDRAIFYAYLVKNLLGLDVHLIEYPGHECTAVHFTDTSVSGDGYYYEGNRYVICDPTYIGAEIGMCMPKYKNTKPIVELWY